jgi:hypothetical protein
VDNEARYLGDGVYCGASVEEDIAVLSTDAPYSNRNARNLIYLERGTAVQLVDYIESWLRGESDAPDEQTP